MAEKTLTQGMTILERLEILKQARENLAKLKMLKEVAYSDWVKDHDLLLRQIEGATMTVAENEENIRQEALQQYAASGSKNPYPGVQIKEMTKLEYSLESALQWAKLHDMALQLDIKKFESLVKVNPPDFAHFVLVKTVPQAQIATDLDKALKPGLSAIVL